jgi:3-methyladenine DNA glycosylase/8-oxoguanine DNA glycosylase
MSRLLYDPAEAARHLGKTSKAFATLVERAGPPRLRREPAPSLFFALARAIASQQLSGKAAATIFGRVESALLATSHASFSPEALESLDDQVLRAAGLSQAKLVALRDLAAHCRDGRVPTLRGAARLADDVLVERLTQVRGVGRWTVEMLLIFRLGRPDVWPIHDLGVQEGARRTFGLAKRPTPKELDALGTPLAPFRSLGAWYLWRATELPED